jgi:hypothetical protein
VSKVALQVIHTPPDRLSELEQRRAALHAESDRLSAVEQTRSRAEEALKALDDEQAKVDVAEREAWRAWSATAEGPSPSPKTAERESIAQRRVLRANDLASALNGAKAVAPRLAQIDAELREIGISILQHRADAVMEEATEINDRIIEQAAVLRVMLVKMSGLSTTFLQLVSETVNDRARQEILRAAQVRFNTFPAPSFDGTGAEVAEAAQAWRRKLT